ncbi:hypothetical protein ACM7NO_26165 [Pseudomonas aeruginosa]
MTSNAKEQVQRKFPDASVEPVQDSLFKVVGIPGCNAEGVTEEDAWAAAIPYAEAFAAFDTRKFPPQEQLQVASGVTLARYMESSIERSAAQAARELANYLNRGPLVPADLQGLRNLLELVTRGCHQVIDATEAEQARRLAEAEELYPSA